MKSFLGHNSEVQIKMLLRTGQKTATVLNRPIIRWLYKFVRKLFPFAMLSILSRVFNALQLCDRMVGSFSTFMLGKLSHFERYINHCSALLSYILYIFLGQSTDEKEETTNLERLLLHFSMLGKVFNFARYKVEMFSIFV